MKTKPQMIQRVFFSIATILIASNCSSLSGQTESGKEIASTGPTILNAHSDPSTVELNRDLQPKKTPEILADVKDFRSKVTDVQLKFTHIPLQVRMENIGGTTWRAELTPQQLQMLAVSGKTIKYDASIVAKNARGQVSESPSTVTVAIKAPDLSTSSTTG